MRGGSRQVFGFPSWQLDIAYEEEKRGRVGGGLGFTASDETQGRMERPHS